MVVEIDGFPPRTIFSHTYTGGGHFFAMTDWILNIKFLFPIDTRKDANAMWLGAKKV